MTDDTSGEPLTINVVGFARMMDAFAKTYGLGLNGQWGKYGGAESVLYRAYRGGEIDDLLVDELVDVIEEGIMVYDNSMGPTPPPSLNVALRDALKKLEQLKEMHTPDVERQPYLH